MYVDGWFRINFRSLNTKKVIQDLRGELSDYKNVQKAEDGTAGVRYRHQQRLLLTISVLESASHKNVFREELSKRAESAGFQTIFFEEDAKKYYLECNGEALSLEAPIVLFIPKEADGSVNSNAGFTAGMSACEALSIKEKRSLSHIAAELKRDKESLQVKMMEYRLQIPRLPESTESIRRAFRDAKNGTPEKAAAKEVCDKAEKRREMEHFNKESEKFLPSLERLIQAMEQNPLNQGINEKK